MRDERERRERGNKKEEKRGIELKKKTREREIEEGFLDVRTPPSGRPQGSLSSFSNGAHTHFQNKRKIKVSLSPLLPSSSSPSSNRQVRNDCDEDGDGI